MKKLIVEISYFDNVLDRPLSAGQEIVVTDERAAALLKVKDGLDRHIVKESLSKNTGREIYMEGTQEEKKPEAPSTPKQDLESPAKTWKEKEPEVKIETGDEDLLDADMAVELSKLSRQDLQARAKELGIKANQKSDVLIEKIIKANGSQK